MRYNVASRSGRMFSSNISRRSDIKSMMAQGRLISLVLGHRGMTGAGFLDILKRFYNTSRRYAGKAADTYNKYAPIAEKVYNVYKNEDVQKFVPKAIKNKTQKLEGFVKKNSSKLQTINDLARQFDKTYMSGVEEMNPMNQMENLEKKEKLPADDLRASLFNQINQNKASLKPSKISKSKVDDPMAELKAKLAARRSSIEPQESQKGLGIYPAGLMSGKGIYPAGLMGSGGLGDIFKMAAKMIPAITDQIQKGSGISDKQVKQINKSAMMKLKPILTGMTQQSGGSFSSIMKSIAEATITPLKLIANIKGQSGGGKKKKNLLKKMENHVAKVLAKSMVKKQKGTGVSFSDVLGGIAQTAAELIPMIL